MVDLVEGRGDRATIERVEGHASRCAECRAVLSSRLLGRALIESAKDARRGRILIDRSAKHMRGDERMAEERADLEAWMRKHGIPIGAP